MREAAMAEALGAAAAGLGGVSKRSLMMLRQRCCKAARVAGSVSWVCCALHASTAAAAADWPRASLSSLLAPIDNSTFTVSNRILAHAACNGVLPLPSRASNVPVSQETMAAMAASEQPLRIATCRG